MSQLNAFNYRESSLQQYFYALRQHLETSRRTLDKLGKHLGFRFNVVEYIRPNENALSDIIRDLLDPNGSHGQGDAFLREFLARFWPNQSISYEECCVRREVLTGSIENFRRRIDIVLQIGDFLLGIENKPWALDQADQVKDYVAELSRAPKWRLLYLSRDGTDPTSITEDECKILTAAGKLGVYSYFPDVTDWMCECERICKADKVRTFIRDLGSWLLANVSPEGVVKTVDSEIEGAPLRDFALREENLELSLSLILERDAIVESILGRFSEHLASKMHDALGNSWIIENQLKNSWSKPYQALRIFKPLWKDKFDISIENDKRQARGFYYGIRKGGRHIQRAVSDGRLRDALDKSLGKKGQYNSQWEWWSWLDRSYLDWNSEEMLRRLYKDSQLLNALAKPLLAMASTSESIIDEVLAAGDR